VVGCLGVNALFVGASGTGKTMAGDVLVNELRLDFYRIDLNQVVSKYIGETEKNLRRVFDTAEDGGAMCYSIKPMRCSKNVARSRTAKE
jgi:SpoVK/Ycf46/Vps4 family AAA+-type ATPase